MSGLGKEAQRYSYMQYYYINIKFNEISCVVEVWQTLSVALNTLRALRGFESSWFTGGMTHVPLFEFR